jgi:hypothetical protein
VRRWVKLPNIPPGLREPAKVGEGLDVVLERRRLLFSYFGASVDTKEQAEELVFLLAAVLFPAFRKPLPAKRRGRPPAWDPKYKVEFLREVAETYDRIKAHVGRIMADVGEDAETPADTIYGKLLRDNPNMARQLHVGENKRNLKLSTFLKLLSIGRRAQDNKVIWSPVAGGFFVERFGEHIVLHPDVAKVYEALEQVQISLFSAGMAETLLKLDPNSEADRRQIESLADEAKKLLDRQAEMGLSPPRPATSVVRALGSASKKK